MIVGSRASHITVLALSVILLDLYPETSLATCPSFRTILAPSFHRNSSESFGQKWARLCYSKGFGHFSRHSLNRLCRMAVRFDKQKSNGPLCCRQSLEDSEECSNKFWYHRMNWRRDICIFYRGLSTVSSCIPTLPELALLGYFTSDIVVVLVHSSFEAELLWNRFLV